MNDKKGIIKIINHTVILKAFEFRYICTEYVAWAFVIIMDTNKLVKEAIEESLILYIESQENFKTRHGYKKVRITQYSPTSIYVDSVSQINEAQILSGSDLLFDSSGEFLVSLLEHNSTETKLLGFEFHLYGTFARFDRELGKIIILELGKLNYKERRSR